MNMDEATVERIVPGSLVEWVSTSAGRTVRKAGMVVRFVPAWTNARSYLRPTIPLSRLKLSPSTYASSIHRYLVVVMGEKNGLAYYYAPRASTVEAQNPAAPRNLAALLAPTSDSGR